MVVPGRGFLLNNELTDFNFTPTQGAAADPNLPAPGKRPRSSMSPTIVLDDGQPFLAVGSPGGATIITTVLQILVNRIDLGMTLPEALAAPRAAAQSAATPAEPAFLAAPGAASRRAGTQVRVRPGDRRRHGPRVPARRADARRRRAGPPRRWIGRRG